METYSTAKAAVPIRFLILNDETRHCEGQSPEAIYKTIKELLRGVYTEHIRYSQCRLRECARNDNSFFHIFAFNRIGKIHKELKLYLRAFVSSWLIY